MTNKGIVFPELIFSKWYQWENRSRIFNLKNPSIYTISLSPLNLDEKRFSWNDVVYIGMTNSVKGLNGRLKQFDRSIQGKSNHHSGGVRIRKELGLYNSEIKGWYNQKEILQIFVSIFNVDLYLSITTKENILNKGLIAYLEYAAFAEFFEYCNGKPKFNKQ